MSLSGVAKDTLAIVDANGYTSAGGRAVSFGDDVKRAIAGTRLYRPDELEALARSLPATEGKPILEVTEETTATAARRLSAHAPVACLNFASAKNPGGGFLGGARAQEEDLARRSALYPSLVTQPIYYEENRKHPSLLYTDHLIFSPRVPFFRDDHLDVVDAPWLSSVVTSPAPNAGEVLVRAPDARPAIEQTLARRAAHVLAVLVKEAQRHIVLGAWGCGVFRNDPVFVARAFGELLEDPRFRGAFERVVFAIYDRTKEHKTLLAFRERFG